MPLHLQFNFVLPNLAVHFMKTTRLLGYYISPLKFEFQRWIETKIRLGGIMIKRSPEEQHKGCSKLLPNSRNRVQRKMTTDIERSTESQVMKYTCSI